MEFGRRSNKVSTRIGRLFSFGWVMTVLSSTVSVSEEPARIVSGADLKSAIEGKFAPEGLDSEASRLMSVAEANRYIAQVVDSTNDGRRCGAGKVKPHEIKDRVYTFLVDVPVDKLNASAADLVVSALERSLPCKRIK